MDSRLTYFYIFSDGFSPWGVVEISRRRVFLFFWRVTGCYLKWVSQIWMLYRIEKRAIRSCWSLVSVVSVSLSLSSISSSRRYEPISSICIAVSCWSTLTLLHNIWRCYLRKVSFKSRSGAPNTIACGVSSIWNFILFVIDCRVIDKTIIILIVASHGWSYHRLDKRGLVCCEWLSRLWSGGSCFC